MGPGPLPTTAFTWTARPLKRTPEDRGHRCFTGREKLMRLSPASWQILSDADWTAAMVFFVIFLVSFCLPSPVDSSSQVWPFGPVASWLTTSAHCDEHRPQGFQSCRWLSLFEISTTTVGSPSTRFITTFILFVYSPLFTFLSHYEHL